MEIKDLSALKVVELKERLEALGLSTNGLKADLVERLREHLDRESATDNDKDRKESDASPRVEHTAPSDVDGKAVQVDSSPKASSPKSHTAQAPNRSAYPKHSDHGNHEESEDSKPSATELARKRAERFGIPVMAKGDEEMDIEQPRENDPEEGENEKAGHDPSAMEKYRSLISESLGESPLLVVEDFLSDSRTASWIEKVIEHSGEEKVSETIKQVAEKIATDFNNDRTSIKSPPRLVSFRFSRSLKSLLPRPDKRERVRKDIDKRGDKKQEIRKDVKKKWTDEEWADWNKQKEQSGGWKKKDWGDWKKGQGDWKGNDWKSKGDYKGSSVSKKNRSYSYDSFESDVEEFIHSNKLDHKASKVLREESKNLVSYVMDQGFTLKTYNNPSKEVMLRMKDYIRKKRDGKNDRGYSARSRSRSRSYSPKPKSNSHSRDRNYRSADYERSVSRGRSFDRGDSRDRYDRRSRSRSI